MLRWGLRLLAFVIGPCALSLVVVMGCQLIDTSGEIFIRSPQVVLLHLCVNITTREWLLEKGGKTEALSLVKSDALEKI